MIQEIMSPTTIKLRSESCCGVGGVTNCCNGTSTVDIGSMRTLPEVRTTAH